MRRSGLSPSSAGTPSTETSDASLQELCRHLVMEAYAPAAVLINRAHTCLCSLGPIDRYLDGAAPLMHDLIAMAPPGLQANLRSAIRQAFAEEARLVVRSDRANHVGDTMSPTIELWPVRRGDEALLLVCFVDASRDDRRIADLEKELDATRTTLAAALRKLGDAADAVRSTTDMGAMPPARRDIDKPGTCSVPAGTNSAMKARPGNSACLQAAPVIFVVDDDPEIREAICGLLLEEGWAVEDYASCEAFFAAYRPGRDACLLVDAYLPGMHGLELLQRLRDAGHHLPAIMITGNSDVTMAVDAMKAGASDFLEKPIGRGALLASLSHALDLAHDSNKLSAAREEAARRIAVLTPRQRQIMAMILAGHPSKNVAADLRISQRTVENHRAAIMHKTGCTSLPALARLALLST